MHMKHGEKKLGQATVPVTFILEDPASMGQDQKQVQVKGALGENILELALENNIALEHTCGGVCACSTCHVYINQGMDQLSPAGEDEEDRVQEAPGLQHNSRLSCQAVIEDDGPIVVQVPAWNRNAVKEVPH